ncbi:LysR family transcriptional regulator [Pseudoalteromonas sp. SSDWG2]|uniref:LysR family transcriptional regulator n=1 Tax=Pseudoalteromonas sp. SSDWG2 TaxID=3139391 RepID=UPI003BAA67B1
MRFEQLKQFLALGSLRHFRQTAEQTNISTSALTRSIQTLEEEVGHQLVSRSTRSVVLTREGERFLKFCQNTLESYHDTRKHLDNLQLNDSQNVTIGYTFAAVEQVSLCAQFMARHPDVKVNMRLYSKDVLDTLLQNADIDLYINKNTATDGAMRAHFTHGLVIFVHNSHPLAATQSVSTITLQHCPLLGCFSQTLSLQARLEEAVKEMHKSNDIRLGSINEIINYVRQGNAIAIATPEHLERIELHDELVQITFEQAPQVSNDLIIKTGEHTADNVHVNNLVSLFTGTTLSA